MAAEWGASPPRMSAALTEFPDIRPYDESVTRECLRDAKSVHPNALLAGSSRGHP
ncbi:hypothetical protein MTS1_01260 [Microbacterium sp. TS-1]|nr:hypothetical protein MTS1_01260 [Microbacterium sp. TS-1]